MSEPEGDLVALSWFVEGMRAERDEIITFLEEMVENVTEPYASDLINGVIDTLTSKEW
jgi:hypothetical protein